MAEVLNKMISADVIVLATPVYFEALAGQMKIVIDRTFARCKELINKEFYFIITAGRDDLEHTEGNLKCFINYLPGAQLKGVLYGENVKEKREILEKEIMQKAYQLGLQV